MLDANGNIVLRDAQARCKLTGYYRPEDMDIDPIALSNGEVRVCWANTGRMSNGGGSVEKPASIYGEVMCLTEEPPTRPRAERRDSDASSASSPATRSSTIFDNVAFQPHTGNLAVTEDGEVEVVKEDGTTEPRGNDILLCLPDGDDDDVQSDGCVRFASLRDTASEPTGIIFTGSGETHVRQPAAPRHRRRRAAEDHRLPGPPASPRPAIVTTGGHGAWKQSPSRRSQAMAADVEAADLEQRADAGCAVLQADSQRLAPEPVKISRSARSGVGSETIRTQPSLCTSSSRRREAERMSLPRSSVVPSALTTSTSPSSVSAKCRCGAGRRCCRRN